jgi:hypothetical protein
VDPYLNKGLNEFQRLILFSQFLTIFGGIMFKMVESVDKLLEIEETPYKRQERDIVSALIVVMNLVAILVYPLYRIIAVISGFKGSGIFFFLKDKVQTAMGDQGKENHSKADFQGQDLTHDFLAEARQLGVFKTANGSQQMTDQPWLISHTFFPRPRSTCVCCVSFSVSSDKNRKSCHVC